MVLYGVLLKYLFLGSEAKKQVSDGSKQVEGYKEAENSVAHVSWLESNASLFSCVTSFFRLHG